MQAEFLLQGVLLNMLDGVAMEDTYAILQDILNLLNNVTQRSTPGELLRTVVVIHMVDMEAISLQLDATSPSNRGSVADITKKKYMQAQEWLLQQVSYGSLRLQIIYIHIHHIYLHIPKYLYIPVCTCIFIHVCG